MNKCLKIELDVLKSDPALSPGSRGGRKIMVSEVYEGVEREADSDVWPAPLPGQTCQVLRTSNAELTFFTEQAHQDRHYHTKGTEIYMVIMGALTIEVDGVDYYLSQGDTLVVQPDAVHQVKNNDHRYICRVITLNCGGEKDKFTV
jgi:quercetin dioxygenase-like cupin family protein